jgi:hypothetical protein
MQTARQHLNQLPAAPEAEMGDGNGTNVAGGFLSRKNLHLCRVDAFSGGGDA